MRRFWTNEENELLINNYRRGAEYCATMLDRSVKAVYAQASKLGLSVDRHIVSDEDLITEIKSLHKLGYSDQAICKAVVEKFGLSVDRHRVSKLRRSIGLDSGKTSEFQRANVSKKTKEQLKAHGLKSLADYRVNNWNKWKRDLGWPESLTVRAVQALEVFWSLGPGVPITRLQLCAAMGFVPKKRTDPPSNAKGGTVMAELARAGFIGIVRKGVPGKFNNKPQSFYYLKHGVAPSGRIENANGKQAISNPQRPNDMAG